MNIFESSKFSILERMEKSFNVVQAEYDNFITGPGAELLAKNTITDSTILNMQQHPIEIAGTATDIGLFHISIDKCNNNPKAVEMYKDHFPETYRLIEDTTDCIPIRMFFNVLYPNTKIYPHTDAYDKYITYNGTRYKRYRSHMGIHVPENCLFTVNYRKVKCAWKEGKAFAWYPSDLHSAQNNNLDKSRTIMLIDFLCP